MHIPDGFLNNGVSTGLIAASAVTVGYSIKRIYAGFLEKVPVVKAKLATIPDLGGFSQVGVRTMLSKIGQEKIERMAVVGALVFAAQMINFPIAHGTSGHLMGGVLAGLILGPWSALLVMVVVLGTQALVFGDGGIIALGANIFNMGIVGAVGGYYFFKFLYDKSKTRKGFMVSAFEAGWASVVAAAICTAVEITLSGHTALSIVLPAMVKVHVLIGLGEAIITVGILILLLKHKFKIAEFEKYEG